jgi:hypothetical protein
MSLADNALWANPLSAKLPHSYHPYFQNLNGIKLDKSGRDFNSLFSHIATSQVDTICVAEHCLNFHQHFIWEQFYNTLQSHCLPHSKFIYSASALPSETQYKLGSTCTFTQGDITTCITSQGSNDMGYWSCQLLSAKASKSILIVTSYQVYKKTN